MIIDEEIGNRRDLNNIFEKLKCISLEENLELMLAIFYDRETGTHECLYEGSETGERVTEAIKNELAKIKAEKEVKE